MNTGIRLTAAFVLVLAAGAADAGSVYYSGGFSGYSYGTTYLSNFTTALDLATNDGVTVDTNLDFRNLDVLLAHDALFIAPPAQFQGLTDAEVENIRAFIATGRKVVMMGEYSRGSGDWDRRILSIVGGRDGGSGHGTAEAIVELELTRGVSSVWIEGGRVAIGGTPLFDQAFANLWGDNVLTIQDFDTLGDRNWDLADNGRFITNVVNWLAGNPTAVPEPSSLVLLGFGLGAGGLILARRRDGLRNWAA